jgi:hypothetical protein
MPDALEHVRLRVASAERAAAVAEPVVTALGARAGIAVAALDELAAALALVLRAAVAPVTIDISRDAAGVAVGVEPVPEARLAPRRAILDGLGPALSAVEARVVLRAEV